MKLPFLCLPVALLAVACAAPTEETSAVDSEIIAPIVTPGTFRLFDEPNHQTNPECESWVDLELTDRGQASLRNGLGGRCSLVAIYDPNPRGYTLRLTGSVCGSKTYEGSRRVPLGPATTGVATVKITDHRGRTCRDVVPAKIILEEQEPGRPATKVFSKDDAPSAEREAIHCRENVDHGAEVTLFENTLGSIVRAKYTETTFIETKLVSDMTVCYPVASPDHDLLSVTGCNDLGKTESYSLELTTGGFTGLPSVQVFRSEGNGGERTLLHSLVCRFTP